MKHDKKIYEEIFQAYPNEWVEPIILVPLNCFIYTLSIKHAAFLAGYIFLIKLLTIQLE